MNEKNVTSKNNQERKLIDFFTPYLGPNTEEMFQESFVEDYFSTIFEKVGVVKVFFGFLPPTVTGRDKIEFWEEVSNYLTEVGNIVYQHKGLLSSVDVNSLQAHWGYPIQQRKSLVRSIYDFSINILQIDKPESLTHLVLLLYVGQAYIGTIGPRFRQTYCAVPSIFLRLPPFGKLPVGMSADKFTRDMIINEAGNEAKIISVLNV